MAVTQLMPQLIQTFYDSNQVALAGGSIYTYAAGTTTPQAAYTDESGNTAQTNPIVLDSTGSAQIWLANLAYKFVIKNSLGTTIRTIDNVTYINLGTITNSMLASVSNNTIKGRVASGTGSLQDLTPAQVTAILNQFVGDSGSGGTQGLVIPPAAGDAAALKYLSAAGTWSQPIPVYRAVTGTDTATTLDVGLSLSGASFTETLYTAVGNSGRILRLIHNGLGDLTQKYSIGTTSGQTILYRGTPYTSAQLTLITPGEFWVVQSNGTNWVALAHGGITTPWTSAGSLVNFYTFTITSGNATIGSTWTNNAITYTCCKTVASGTTVIMSGSGNPLTSGTLTKASGTGDATLTFSAYTGAANNIGATIIAPIFYGSPENNSLQFKRDGQDGYVWLNLYQSVAGPSGGSGDYTWPMPTNMKIDTTVIPQFTTTFLESDGMSETAANIPGIWPGSIGGWMASNSSLFLAPVCASPYASDGSTFRIFGSENYTLTPFTAVGSTYISANNIMALNIMARFPITGWFP